MLDNITPEQWAIIGMAAGAAITVGIQKCPKPYAWVKAKVSWAHMKLDSVELPEGVGEDVAAVYTAAKEAVEAVDKALEDDKVTYGEITVMVSKAFALIKKAKALL